MRNVLERLSPGARVAVVRLRSMGDCVLTTPALALLKQARPDLDPYHPLNNARGRFLDLSPEEQAQLERGTGAAKGGGS